MATLSPTTVWQAFLTLVKEMAPFSVKLTRLHVAVPAPINSGGRVPIVGVAGGAELYRNRGNQLIRLNRRSGVVSPRGKYRCEIPDESDVVQKIFITLN